MPTVTLTDNPSISAWCAPLKTVQQEVTKAYFASREEEAQYETTVIDHVTSKGQTLAAIAKQYSVETKDVKRTLTKKYLQIGEIVKVTTKKKTTVKVKFTKLNKATVGEEVYIVVETKHLEEETILINILQGQEDVLAKKDELITVQVANNDETLIETKVGNYCDEEDITNKDDFKNWAIVKIKLHPKEEVLQKEWLDGLQCANTKKAQLYLLVDAHSKSSLPDFKSQYIFYNGFKAGKDDSKIPNHFLNEDQNWFEVENNLRAPWMNFAIEEGKIAKGVKEGEKPLSKRVIKYHKYVGIVDNPKTTIKENDPSNVAWCASFVSWCFGQANISNPKSVGSRFYLKEKGSDKTLVEIDKPIYGAVAVFSDCSATGKLKSSGHVSFVFGKKTETDLLLLGGNQGNRLKVSKYDCSKNVFLSYKTKAGVKHYKILRGFYIPKDYVTSSQDELTQKDTYASAKEANKALLNINIENNKNGEASR